MSDDVQGLVAEIMDIAARKWRAIVGSLYADASWDSIDGVASDAIRRWVDGAMNANVLIVGPTGSGKQQPVSEPVLTPSGWRPIGDLAPGDSVIGADGLATKVRSVHPQQTREVWRVEFSDGSWTRCGPEHLWSVTYWGRGPGPHGVRPHVRKFATFTTDAIRRRGLNVGRTSRAKFSIPLTKPVVYEPQGHLPVDPYTLGVILGDGHITERGYVGLTTDEEILGRLGVEGSRTSHPSDGIGVLNTNVWEAALVAMGLAGKLSHEKFVPEPYLHAAPDQRRDLLAGLLDTDGHASRAGGVEFTSTSADLAFAVQELTQSLGGVVRSRAGRVTKYPGPDGVKRDGRMSWRVNVKLDDQPFRLARKAEAWVGPTKYPVARHIRSIDRVDDEDSVCISVEAVDGLYLTRGFVVTHNTYTAVAMLREAMNAGATVGMVTAVNLFASLRPSGEPLPFRPDRIHVLCIDDLGVEKPSDWTDETLDWLVNERHVQMKPTIITTNLDPVGLERHLGLRVWSRLCRDAIKIKMTGEDRRRARA